MTRVFRQALWLSLYLLCVPALGTAADPAAAATPPGPTWQGYATDGKGWRIRVELELSADSSGKPLAYVNSADMVSGRFPATETTVDGDKVRVVIFPNWISLEGHFNSARSEFTGSFDNWGEKLALKLKRDNPEFRCYSIPRCDSRQQPVTTYAYAAPPRLRDGWATGTLASVGMERAPLEDLMRRTLAGEYKTADAVLVARHGKLVFEEYTYGSSREHLHTLQSATKTIASLLVGTTLDRGEIANVSQPVYQILSTRRGHAWIDKQYPITLENVLAMSAGLHWENLNTAPITESDDFKMAVSPDIVGYILDRNYDGPANGQFLYNSGLSILLAAIAQDASHQDAAQLAEQRLFGPLGIHRYKWMRHTSGIVHSGGGLYLTARDALKLGQMVLDKGQWRGKQVLSAKWIEDSTSPHSRGGELDTRRKTYGSRYGYPDADYLYGYQWWLLPVSYHGKVLRAAMAWGNGEQWIIVVPELDLVTVLLSSDAENAHTRRIDRLVKYVLPAINEADHDVH